MSSILKLRKSALWTFSCAFEGYRSISNTYFMMNRREKSYDVSNMNTTKDDETYVVYTRETTDTLHFNAEDLTEDMQALFAKHKLEDIKKKVKQNVIKNISFNSIHENIFRCHLNMQMRKLGYNSVFQRYNDDKGLAVFSLKKEEIAGAGNIGAYNQRALARLAQGIC